jgi:hypothetical protein
MQMKHQRMENGALPIDKSASVLGIDEFSLLSRIRAGDIVVVRARSGEMVVPESELERLIGMPVHSWSFAGDELSTGFPDSRLGIQSRERGRIRNGERLTYKVPDYPGRFNESEINGYRAAFGAIAGEFESLLDLRRQLNVPDQAPACGDFELNTAETGRWEVRSALLNLTHGEVLLCQQGNEFAIIERFQEGSSYAQVNASTDILMRGDDPHQLIADFKGNAQHTLEFMASNLAAKAQKVIWEQFPNNRPSEVMAAISERCHQAVASEQSISEGLALDQQPKVGHTNRV